MRVSEVEKLTGLPRKTIRFYEEKGLLHGVARAANSYREYSEAVVGQLTVIATLRRAGVSLSDIQLWQDKVITTSEMLKKRISELKSSAVVAEKQFRLCRELLDGLVGESLPAVSPAHPTDDAPLQDNAETVYRPSGDAFLSLGIDIGTTTISAVVLDLTAGMPVGVYTIAHGADLPDTPDWDKRQDVGKLASRVRKMLDALLNRFPSIGTIGFTGQMHGILYINAQGEPVSDLYTWQDGRAGRPDAEGRSVCDRLFEKTGYRLSPGYGLATHVWLTENHRLPDDAVKLCTVMDYIAASLCGSSPVMHSSNAASLGFFSVGDDAFDTAALRQGGIDPDILPPVVGEGVVLGTYRHIPVTVAIGDNQAGVFGSVGEDLHAILANFGTGSQVSVICPRAESRMAAVSPEIEIRPFSKDAVLLSGSALCGGRAYAILERFFSTYAAQDRDTTDLPEQYETMNRLAKEGRAQILQNPDTALRIRTTFCGTRADAALRGCIDNLGEENFTPAYVIAGTLYGMAQELYDMYRRMTERQACPLTALVVSGNAARKNQTLCDVLGDVFGLTPKIPQQQEEAAYGCAMFAARTARYEQAAPLLAGCIRYREVL